MSVQPARTSPGASTGSLAKNLDFLRLWWVGLGCFMIRWLEILVFGIFTYQQTGSTLTVAVMTMLRLVPMALFGAAFGVIAERIIRRNALLLILTISLITALILSIIAFNDSLQVWHLAVASFINGVAWAADNPVRRTAIGEVAGQGRLSTAMAIEVGTSNASRLAGPGLGGLLMASHGIVGPLAFSVVIYLLVLFPAFGIRYRNEIAPGPPRSIGRGIAQGFDLLRIEPRLIGVMWLTMVFNIFAWPILSMVPVFGADQLGLGPDGIGLLASTDGLGALVGAIVLGIVASEARYGKIYVGGVVAFMVMVPFLAYANHPAQAAAALFCIGFGQAAFAVMQSTLTYVIAPAGMRSQAMGFMTMCIGIGPLGFLAVGQLAEIYGAPNTAAGSALAGLLVTGLTWPWWRPMWRNLPSTSNR
ncbi:MAG: MFS transporter [Burkholderiaceae bacterium]